MSVRLIDLIADHIRHTYSARTYVEVDETRKTVRVDGIPIGTITDQTIDLPTSPEQTILLDAREPNFFDRLSRNLYWVLNSHDSLESRRQFRDRKEYEGIRKICGLKP